jgi:hypothetical protein
VSPAEERVRVAVAELAEALLAAARESRPPGPSAPVELLSPAAFARRAGLGRSSVYVALATGDIRSLKVRGRRLIPASELVRLAESAT